MQVSSSEARNRYDIINMLIVLTASPEIFLSNEFDFIVVGELNCPQNIQYDIFITHSFMWTLLGGGTAVAWFITFFPDWRRWIGWFNPGDRCGYSVRTSQYFLITSDSEPVLASAKMGNIQLVLLIRGNTWEMILLSPPLVRRLVSLLKNFLTRLFLAVFGAMIYNTKYDHMFLSVPQPGLNNGTRIAVRYVC